ncbi:glutaredoxin [Nannocystaceae bacterium ST9]|jgi:monothiol glutaredoxin
MPNLSNPRPLLADENKSERVRESIANFHAAIIEEVRATVERDTVVVVGMQTNPFVKKARKALADKGIAFTYLEYGGYRNMWKPRLAIKMWSGWPTFPQVFVRGALIGGFDDLRKAIDDGSFDQRLKG